MYYSSGGTTNSTPNPFTSDPSPASFPFHYYQQDRILFPAEVTAPRVLEDYSTSYNFANKLNSDTPTMMSSLPPAKSKPAHTFRKDRHSKIVTAQGPRDRRVRLSIQVARKFFDLHDTLGLDKASETLDWLLTNSQSAIDDLVKSKHSSFTTVDEGYSRSDSTTAAEIGDKHYMKSKSMILSDSTIDITQDHSVSMHHDEKARIASLLARESRAKARARARERTRHKMSIGHLFETKKLSSPDFRIQAHHLSTCNELSYLNESRAPYFNADTDRLGQSTIPELFPETKPQTSVIMYELSLQQEVRYSTQ